MLLLEEKKAEEEVDNINGFINKNNSNSNKYCNNKYNNKDDDGKRE